jgi:hypothetical protein
MMSSALGRIALTGAAAALCTAAVMRAQVPARVTDGATFTASGAVVRPVNYREWVYLSAGLGMSYAPEAAAEAAAAASAGQPRPAVFDTVFVNPQSYRAFMQSGKWPEGTMFILELRRGERHVSIDTGGQTQGGLIGLPRAGRISGWAAAAIPSPSRRCRIPPRRRATAATASTRRWRTPSCSSIRRCSKWRRSSGR